MSNHQSQFVSSSARVRVDFVVHRNAHSGSPRLPGSTSLSRASIRPGMDFSARGRPAPGTRTRSDGSSDALETRAPDP